MFLSDHFINEELSENFMDAILLLVLIPQEGKKAIFHTENEAEREKPNLGKGLEATKKTNQKQSVLQQWVG